MNQSTNADLIGFRMKVVKNEAGDGYVATSNGLTATAKESATAVRDLTKQLHDAQMTGGPGKTKRMA